ncbi:MAG: hypothetical protein NT007_05580 [Candidatus Kapabacteria bacterium]|nr:hypothetical protein [Candidatus Kapabacteria bacterium]
MKTRNIHVSVIPAHAGIPFHGAIGDFCIRRYDKKLQFSHKLMRRNDIFGKNSNSEKSTINLDYN